MSRPALDQSPVVFAADDNINNTMPSFRGSHSQDVRLTYWAISREHSAPSRVEMRPAMRTAHQQRLLRPRAPSLAADLAELVRVLRSLVDPYRPEIYYMRGPGPKWHAKHDPAPAIVDASAVPVPYR